MVRRLRRRLAMTRISSPVLAAALALVAARTASAQPPGQPPGPPPPPPPPAASQPPPAGGDGSDLSHIRGTPVPVGEHNEYYYRYRRINLSTNPLGWMLGIYGVSASYGLTNHIALRGDVNYFDFLGGDETGFEFGAGLPIYFRRTYSGVFLEPGFIVRQFGEEQNDITTLGPQVLVGWHWMWDSGLNLAIAAGVGRNWSDEESEFTDYDEEEPFVNGYLRFGYAF
jgi:hypothetical protein